MVVFKVDGSIPISKNLFEISTNNSKFEINIVENAQKYNISAYEVGTPYNNDNRNIDIYVNGKLTPINQAFIAKNEWVSVIFKFSKTATSDSTSYFVAYGSTTSLNISIFSSYSQSIDSKRESIVYNFWGDIDSTNWYNYQTSYTWQTVFGTTNDLSASIGVNTIWDTFLNRNNISQTKSQLTLDDIIPLNMGQYQYETYSSIVKQSIYRSPA